MAHKFSSGAGSRRDNPRLSLAASLAILAFASSIALLLQVSHVAYGGQIIALSGELAPDGNGTFSDFRRPRLNEAGQVAFWAYLNGTSGGSDDDEGIFRGESGIALTQIVRKQLPGAFTPGWSDLTRTPAINDSGQVAFLATYQPSLTFGGGSPPRRGEFRGSGFSPTHIALEGNAAPGGGTHTWFGQPEINEAGEVAFSGEIDTGPAFDAAVFRGIGGPVTLIAREGQAAPDGNGTLRWFFSDFPALNKSGQVAFGASLYGTSGGASDDRGIFRGSGGALTQIAREGQTAPDGNGVFSDSNFLNYLPLNNSGQVAFQLELTGTSGGSNDDSGIFLGDGGAITQIAREGDIAPDGDGYLGQIWYPALNNAGEVAFTADITGTKGGLRDGEGVFRGAGRRLTQIARRGQSAPDGNGTFSFFEMGSGALNDAGQLAFRSYLTGTSGGTSDDLGLFFFNGVELQQIVRTGQALGGSIVTGASLSNNPINELGQVAYRAHLENGKEAIVLWTPPELVGDYNGDGIVDAADYVVWRKNESTTNMLSNDPLGGTIDQDQFNLWRTHFGQTAGSGSASNSGVPEPSPQVTVLVGLTAVLIYRRTAIL
jgi:hypothetical protein